MLSPLRENSKRKMVASGAQMPFPFRGLNARDRLEVIGFEYAQVLDNLNIMNGQGEARKGFNRHALCLDAASDVKALLAYSGAGTDKLFACCGGNIDDVSAGSPGSSDVTGQASDEWLGTMYSTTSGTYLVAANGSDAVQNYDGSSWIPPSITGVTSSDLDAPFAFKGRLWFVEAASQSVWYLAANAIAGAATEFPLGALLQRGGSIVAINSWSSDSGDGIDDRIVFITSEGEILIYSGINPASDFALVGIFHTAKPVSKNCFCRFGGELTIYTVAGPRSLAEIVSGVQGQPNSFGDIIRTDIEAAWLSDSAQFGWNCFSNPNTGWMHYNVPWVSNGEPSRQYIYQTGAWVRHIGQPALCWAVHDGSVYFGGEGGAVYKAYHRTADVNYANADIDIATECIWGWSQFGTPMRKRFIGARMSVVSDVEITPAIEMMVDYSLETPETTPLFRNVIAATWDEASWDESAWADGAFTFSPYVGLFRMGQAGALRVRNSFQGPEIYRIQSATIYFEKGGVL